MNPAPRPPAYLPGFTPSAERRHRRGTRVLLGFLATCGVLFLAMIVAGVFIAVSGPTITPAASQPTAVSPPTAVPTLPVPVAPVPDVAAASFPGGIYEVGTTLGHIAPGKYRTEASSGYWARLRAMDGETSSIIANGMVNGPTVLTVKPTDVAVQFDGPAIWNRVG